VLDYRDMQILPLQPRALFARLRVIHMEPEQNQAAVVRTAVFPACDLSRSQASVAVLAAGPLEKQQSDLVLPMFPHGPISAPEKHIRPLAFAGKQVRVRILPPVKALVFLACRAGKQQNDSQLGGGGDTAESLSPVNVMNVPLAVIYLA
jgi:hypothetical protein